MELALLCLKDIVKKSKHCVNSQKLSQQIFSWAVGGIQS